MNQNFFYSMLLICLLTILSTSFFSAKVGGQIQSAYSFRVAFPNLTFDQPDGIFPDPTNANRLFVLEQAGIIRVFNKIEDTAASKIFLNITDKVLHGGEEGLLGLAFHANFSQNPYFYVDYVADNPLRTVISRYTVQSDNSDMADKNSEKIVLEISQPFSNHKGGQLSFGPDGNLYIGVGDGGSEGDPLGNGQNRATLLGKILRINVDSASTGPDYSISSDNPYVDNNLGFREEIFAYGFRNPWRFSFDSATGQLWVADVGQDRMEEIDVVEKGKNYGWNIMEGSSCYNPASGCNQTGLELPVWNYTHDLGNAIIGGFVYHGQDLPSLDGSYIYGDFGSGRIWALRVDGASTVNSLLVDSSLNIASFGLDQQNELYFSAYDGRIYKLEFNVIPEFPWQTGLALILTATFLILVLLRKREKLLQPTL